MKQKSSISHNEAVIRELREDSKFAVEYLKAAMEDDDEPRVLLIALRQIAEARGGNCRSRSQGGHRAGKPASRSFGQGKSAI
jgi:DNA-binding phage protein